jgi:phosphoribosyl 1,2-cyclic phosphate phosphodiesterase
MAYLTDFKQLMEGEIEKLRGVKLLVVNALRFEPHYSHFCVEEALDLISKVKPRKAYLTHLSHTIGLHAQSESKLPEGVSLAYDRLSVEI